MNKKALYAYARQNGYRYPLYIPMSFVLFGGAIDGVLAYIPDVIGSIQGKGAPLDIISYVVFGWLFGIIPASVTGIYVYMRAFFIVSLWDYVHLYVVGTIISMVFFGRWINVDLYTYQGWLDLWIIGSVGGISAMILGKLVIPKLKISDLSQ